MIGSLFDPPLGAGEIGPVTGEPPVMADPGAGPAAPRRWPCVNHARMPSVYSCEVCRARICVTCAFTFPGDRRFCPACATAPRDALSPARARTVTSSLVLAGVGTAAIVGMPVLGALGGTAGPQGSTAIGLFMLYLGFGPALIGMIMAISSLQRGGANPPRVWAGIVWNGAIAGVFLLMMLMGLFLKGH